MKRKVEREIEAFKRELLQGRLGQLYPKQLAFFHSIFPNGVSEDKLVEAIDLCDRTIKKNEAGRKE